MIINKSFKTDLGRGYIYFEKNFKEKNLFKNFYNNNFGIKIKEENYDDHN